MGWMSINVWATFGVGSPGKISRILTSKLMLGRYVGCYATAISCGIFEWRPRDVQLAKKCHLGQRGL